MVLTTSTLSGIRPRFLIANMEAASFSTTLAGVRRMPIKFVLVPGRLFNALEVLSSMELSPV
jgi:hypothetical protein